jgi:D-alanine transaminase
MNTLPALPCYLNGEFTTLPDAKISVMDRGFIFGDGVYEVAPVYQGQLFRFENHMARLERSLKELRIPNPYTQAQWASIAIKLIATYADSISAKAQDTDQLIYLQISRGVAMRDHVMPEGHDPHRVHDDQWHEAAQRRAAQSGRGLCQRGRLSLGKGSHQGHQSAGRGVCKADQF